MWGISAQVYELRSSRNWGIGDFEDVESLCTLAAEAGADFVGLNPLHALFQAEPKRCSPYSPSNRRFLNPLYLAVDKLPNFDRDLVPQEQLARARECELVDYPLVSQLKLTVLRQLWQRWNESDADDGRFSRQRFTAFLEEGGDALRGHCLFEALSFHMTAEGYGSGWQSWPSGYHDCTSDEVQAFAAARGDEIQFHAWLQWLTALQLEEVAAHAKALRMRIGLYLDFAVGEVPDGSSTWSKPELVLPGIHVGAPPDAFSAKGQDWGLVPLSPVPLLDAGNAHYKDLVDRTARYAGALRLDHVLGLWQLFLIPEGETAAAGGYMRYPFKEVMGHLAVVSQARQTIIVGEDLGNVPVGFRPALKKAGALGYRVLYFENVENDDLIKNRPPSASLTCLSTHDLPPLTGWWAEDDIDFAQGQGWCDGETATRLRAERTEQKSRILQTPVVDLESHERVVQTGIPLIGNVALGPRGRAAFAVRVPIQRKDKVRAVLSAVVRPAIVTELLYAAGLPPTWTAWVVDGQDRLVASTGAPALAGSLSSEFATFSGASIGSATLKDGGELRVSEVALSETPWRVRVGLPVAEYSQLATSATTLLMGASCLTLLLSGSAAFLFHREVRARSRERETVANWQRMDALGKLTGQAAHDFNNLLMVFQSGVEGIKRRRNDEKRVNQLLSHMSEGVSRGKAITQRLLSFSRRSNQGAEHVDLDVKLLELNPLLQQAVNDSILIDIKIPEDTWPVHVDPASLEIALINLFTNSREAMEDGLTSTVSLDEPLLLVEAAAGAQQPAESWLELQRQTVEHRLLALLTSDDFVPLRLAAAMSHSLIGGGKRFRPLFFLCMIGDRADNQAAIDVACAIEMVHSASLVLDDLPCMDDAELRRRQPTTHKLYGEATAILAAVSLLSRGFSTLSSLSELAPDLRAALLSVLAKAVGHEGLAGGQELDLHGGALEDGLAGIEQKNWLKTGALFVATAEMAGLLGGRSPAEKKALLRFASHLGSAFQALDDYLDATAAADLLGKDTRKDQDRATIVSGLGPAQARKTYRQHLQLAYDVLAECSIREDAVHLMLSSIFDGTAWHTDEAGGAR
eukprot:g3893.t1